MSDKKAKRSIKKVVKKPVKTDLSQLEPVGDGNNDSSPSTVNNQCYKYDFVINNYTETELSQVKATIEKICKKAIIGKEIGEQGTPHLQGYISLKIKKRIVEITKLSGFERASLRKCRNEGALIEYCGKDKNVWKFGMPEEVVLMTKEHLRPEQLKIAEKFIEREDPLFGRKIFWYWEDQGNWGKSILATYMIDQMGAFEVSGANSDILCGVQRMIENSGKCPPIIIFDIPRVNNNHVSYQAIEQIKNGKFFSGKYESGMVRFNKPHIVIFSNEKPELDKLSADRWIVEKLKKVKGEKEKYTIDDILEEENTD